MSGERVSIIEGHQPIIIVAPHGCPTDDVNTDKIAEKIAIGLDSYAVINRGWQRLDRYGKSVVDEINDVADCNNVTHMVGVIKDEFLDPLVRFKNRCLKKHGVCYIYMIHGMSNDVRIRAGDPQLEIILGYGAGSPNSFSCEVWRKDLFAFLLNKLNMTCYQGKPGGSYSGWARGNMNQLFRKHMYDSRVQSMQIEIVRALRSDDNLAYTSQNLITAIYDSMNYNSFSMPGGIKVREF